MSYFSPEQVDDYRKLHHLVANDAGRIPWELRKIRRSKGLTQKAMGQMLGWSAKRISAFERSAGIGVTLIHILYYAFALDENIKIVIQDNSNPPPLGIRP